MDVLIMIVSAAAIICLVKYGLLRGIDNMRVMENSGDFTMEDPAIPEP